MCIEKSKSWNPLIGIIYFRHHFILCSGTESHHNILPNRQAGVTSPVHCLGQQKLSVSWALELESVPFWLEYYDVKSWEEQSKVGHVISHNDANDWVPDVRNVVQLFEAHEKYDTLEGKDGYREDYVSRLIVVWWNLDIRQLIISLQSLSFIYILILIMP